MPPRYTIFRLLPATGEKIPLHQHVPEQLSDWLCKMCDLEMRPADRKRGCVIVKEPVARPVHRQVVAPKAS